MKTKQLTIFGIIFAVLVVGVIIKQQQKPAELVEVDYAPLDFQLNQDKVSAIEISKGGETISIAKGDQGWNVLSQYGALGDESKIRNLLADIAKVSGEVRGSDASLFADFGIAEDQAYRVSLSDASAQNLLTFYLGLKKAGADSFFIRNQKDSLVYLTQTNLFEKMGIYGDPEASSLGQNFWVDTRLVLFSKTGVNGILIEPQDGSSIQLAERPDPEDEKKKVWQIVGEEEAELDKQKVRSYLDTLEGLRAKGILETPQDSFQADQLALKLTLTSKDGSEKIIAVGPKDEEANSHPVRVSGQPALYELSNYYLQNISADSSTFVKPTPETEEDKK